MSRLVIAFCLTVYWGSVLPGTTDQLSARRALQPANSHLTGTDLLLLADFTDETHAVPLNDAFRQALRAALEESPYLNLVPEAAIALTLRSLPAGQAPSAVTSALCQRTGSKAYLTGATSRVHGGAVNIALAAIDCTTGGILAQEHVTSDETSVVDALGAAARRMRLDLGESSQSVNRFTTLLSRATSPSLEALRAWSEGLKALREQGAVAAIPFFRTATGMDTAFTAAVYDLGIAYRNSGNETRARESFARAFLHRERANVRRRFAIAGLYYGFVTVQVNEAIATFKDWMRTYPRDERAVSNLGSLYGDVCRYRDAIAAFEKARQMNPSNYVVHENLMEMLLATGEFAQVRATYRQMKQQGLDDDSPHVYLYAIASLEGDSTGIAEQRAWFDGKADIQHEIVSEEADAAAYRGHLARARKLTEQAVQLAMSSGNKEQAAAWLLNSAWREGLFGNLHLARQQTLRALEIAPDGREGAATAAIILARSGDVPRAEAEMEKIEKQYPHHTVMQSYWLPMIRAQIALQQKDASTALKELRKAEALDTLYPQVFFYSHMPSVVLRAEAYLMLGQSVEALRQWQIVLDNPGIVQLSATAAIARLQIARTHALHHRAVDASSSMVTRQAYQTFLSLWRDADTDIPVMVEARREFCGLFKSDSHCRSPAANGASSQQG